MNGGFKAGQELIGMTFGESMSPVNPRKFATGPNLSLPFRPLRSKRISTKFISTRASRAKDIGPNKGKDLTPNNAT